MFFFQSTKQKEPFSKPTAILFLWFQLNFKLVGYYLYKKPTSSKQLRTETLFFFLLKMKQELDRIVAIIFESTASTKLR